MKPLKPIPGRIQPDKVYYNYNLESKTGEEILEERAMASMGLSSFSVSEYGEICCKDCDKLATHKFKLDIYSDETDYFCGFHAPEGAKCFLSKDERKLPKTLGESYDDAVEKQIEHRNKINAIKREHGLIEPMPVIRPWLEESTMGKLEKRRPSTADILAKIRIQKEQARINIGNNSNVIMQNNSSMTIIGSNNNVQNVQNGIEDWEVDNFEDSEGIQFTNEIKYGRINFEDIMENDIKKKAIIDLLLAPISFIPIMGGLSTLIIAWAIGSVLGMTMALCSAVVGSAIFVNRLVFGLEDITKNAYEQLLKQKKLQRNKFLDELDKALRDDRDARPEQCLRELRVLHELLVKEAEGDIVCGSEILTNFESMFEVCIKKIEKTDQLWRSAKGLHNTAKKKFLEERENLVKELMETTEHLSSVVKQTKDIKEIKEDSDLAQMTKELERSLHVARKTEEQMANFKNGSNYDPKEFLKG